MKKVQKIIAALLAICVLAALFASCKPAEDADETGSPASPGTSGSASGTPSETPGGAAGGGEDDSYKYGGTLVVSAGDPNTLFSYIDPVITPLNVLMNDYFLMIDLDTGDVIYRVCESHEVSADGLIYTFHVRDGVRWHDGVKLTADQIVYSHDIWQDADWFYRMSWTIPGKWEAIDELTVRVTLDKPEPGLLEMLSMYFNIFPKHLLEDIPYAEWMSSDLAFHPIGIGPFKFGEYAVGDQFNFIANEDYWGGRPYLDEIIMKIMGGGSPLEIAFETGQISTMGLEKEYYNEIKDQTDKYTFILAEPTDYYFLDLSSAAGKWFVTYNTALREAIGYMVDYDAINDKLLYGYGVVPKSVLAPSVLEYAPVSNFTYDLEKANRLLDEAGFTERDANGYRIINPDSVSPDILVPTGSPIAIQLWYFMPGSLIEYMCVILAEAMQQCGILAVPYLASMGTFMESFLDGDKDFVDTMKNALQTAVMGFVLPISTGGPYLKAYEFTLNPRDRYAYLMDSPGWLEEQQSYEWNDWITEETTFAEWLSIYQGFSQERIDIVLEVDRLMIEYSNELNPAIRTELLYRIQDIYMNQIFDIIPLCAEMSIVAWQKNVHIEEARIDLRVTTRYGFYPEKLWVE